MDKREPPTTSDDIVMQQYPSPSADGTDLTFYTTNPRDQQLDSQMEQQHEQPQEPSSPAHLERRASVSAEELQLAAQLTQGLAPMMEAGSLHNAHETHEVHDEHGLPSHDHTLPNHDPLVHNHNTGLQEQDPGLHPQDPHLHHVVQHQEQQPHQYAEHAQVHSYQPAHMQLSQMAQQAFAPVDNTPPRKRSKVSRACDECRRKKVRCDAASETGEEQCTNCRKAQMPCLFSRIPQKRGPSKGYIKELADRIHSIEGKLGGQPGSAEVLELLGGARRESTDHFSPSLALNENSKRPFATMSSETFSSPDANRLAGWASETRPTSHQPTYGGPRLAPRPVEDSPSSRPGDVLDGPPAEAHAAQVPEIEDNIYLGYLTIIHPLLPLLPESKLRLQQDLAECPSLLRQAFNQSLKAVIQSFQMGLAAPLAQAQSAIQTLHSWEGLEGPRSSVVNLIHLRVLLLLAIEADNHGPASLKAEHGGQSRTSLLAQAVAVAYSMGLRSAQRHAEYTSEQDINGHQPQAMRTWWSLVALDRWNAAGTGQDVLIPQGSIVLSSGLKTLLGETTFQFLELSYLLDPMMECLLPTIDPLSSSLRGGGSGLSKSVNAMIELWRVNLPATMTSGSHAVLFLAYWHVRLLGYLLIPEAQAVDALWAATESANLLAGNPQLLSPFTHHFSSLTGIVLAELTTVDKIRDEAAQALADTVVDAAVGPPHWDVPIRSRIAEKLRLSMSSGVEATASQSLQHLADLATATGLATEASNPAEKGDETRNPRSRIDYEDLGFDPREIIRIGYLNAV